MSMFPAPSISTTSPNPLWRLQLWLLLCIVLACLVGIYSRPIGYLASLWPANAIMLGILLRHPALGKTPETWLLALAAYILTDLANGASLFLGLTLNIANVVGVFCAWLYLHRQSHEVLTFQRQRSVGVLFIGCVLGALGCTAAGAWAASVAFDLPFVRSAALWGSGEFYNYILFVPLFMAAPKGWIWQWNLPLEKWDANKLWPLVALLVSEALGILIGGPGAIAFLMPAMVWCAMTYRVFPITVLNVVVCFGKTAAIALGAFSFTPGHVMEATSYRTGLALLSLAPLAVACAYVLRLQALNKLHHAVNHDFLTGVLARRALMERGQKLLSRLQEEGQELAVIMADIDHFKRVNDRYGHAQGDVVLQEFAAIAHNALRPDDLLGRVGGEEFAIVLPRTSKEQALSIGERLCELVRQHHFAFNQTAVPVTVSIGLHAISTTASRETLEQLLSKADQALYMAKNNGRDQVQQYGSVLIPSTV